MGLNFAPLETEGGKLFVLLVLVAWLSIIAMVLHLAGKGPAETGRTLLSNAFTSFITLIVSRLSKK